MKLVEDIIDEEGIWNGRPRIERQKYFERPGLDLWTSVYSIRRNLLHYYEGTVCRHSTLSLRSYNYFMTELVNEKTGDIDFPCAVSDNATCYESINCKGQLSNLGPTTLPGLWAHRRETSHPKYTVYL